MADLGSRLGSSGANLKDLNDIYEGFNTLLAVNAVNSQQAASAQLQLNQALGSGKLAGEEFNAINEATPQLLDEVAKVLGVARGELKQLASDGEISAQVLIEALRRTAEQGGDALADFFKTPAGQLKLFDKAIQDFQVTIGQQLLPVFTPIVEAASTLLGLFGQLPGPIKATAVAVTALGAAFAILGGPVTAVVAAIVGITLVVKKLADENKAFADALKSAWNGILAALNGVGAFFQAFFASITQQADAFIQYWQGIGTFLADTWNQGIANITEAFGRWQGYYNQVVQAIADAWNQLMQLIPDAFHKAITALGQIFSPFVGFLNNAFGGISNAWNSLLESMGLNWGTLINEMIAAVLPLTRVFKAMGIDIGEAISGGVKAGFKAFESFKPAALPELNLPGVSGLTTTPTPSSGNGGGSGGGKGSGAAEKEAQRQLELQNKLKQGADELLAKAQERLRVIEGITDYERIQAEGSSAINDVKREYAKLLEEAQEIADAVVRSEVEQTLKAAQAVEIRNEELETRKEIQELQDNATASIDEEIKKLEAIVTGREEEYERLKEIKELEASMRNAGIDPSGAAAKVDRRNELKAQNEELEKTKGLIEEMSGTIASGFTDAIRSVINGTKSVDEAFSDMLSSIGQSFVDMALKVIEQQLVMIANGLLMKALGISMPGASASPVSSGAYGDMSIAGPSFFQGGMIPGFADGGPVKANRPIIVGEEGQELFIPSISGTIVPNDIFEATKAALIEDGEAVPAEEADETKDALSANNSSISTTYNNSSSSTGTASGTSENSSAISTAINTGISTALSQNSQSINSTRFGDTTSTSVSEALAVNNQSIQNQKQNATNTMERETMQQMMDSPSKLTVAYESTVINQQEYVTAEQHQKGVTQAAMKGRDMALASLKNSVRARKGIGLA